MAASASARPRMALGRGTRLASRSSQGSGKQARNSHAPVGGIDPATRKDKLAGHELQVRMPLAHDQSRLDACAVDQDHRRGIDRTDQRPFAFACIGIEPRQGRLRCNIRHDCGPASPVASFRAGDAPKPCIRLAHCNPTMAPLTGWIMPSDMPMIIVPQTSAWVR